MFSHSLQSGLLALTLLVVGCGADPNAGGGGGALLMGGAEYLILDKGTLKTDAGISGTGSIVFKDPRSDEDSNYKLAFALQKGGTLTLMANANGKLTSGVGIRFARNAADDLLQVFLLDGGTTTELTDEFDGALASAAIELSVDVHGHGHLIVFKGGDEHEYTFNGRPKGRLWGLKLDKATVTNAIAGAPIEEH